MIDIDIEDMEQSSTSNVENAVSALRSRDTYGAATFANYTSGAFKGVATLLACGPSSLQVPAAALSLAGEMLSSESTEMKDDQDEEFKREMKSFMQETRQHMEYQVRFNNWMGGKSRMEILGIEEEEGPGSKQETGVLGQGEETTRARRPS